jgi:hypothetical protein
MNAHTQLPPDRDMLAKFSAAMFKHAGTEGYVSLRAFYEDDSTKPFRITPTSMKGGLPHLIEAVEDDANRAANHPRKVVFCPPVAIFNNPKQARESDILAGLALSVECDQRPREARATLEDILGPATLVVRSGGAWTDPANGQVYDKLHLHWRLRIPARGADLATLKQARDLAARLVGGDPSNKPVCHPIRWPGSWHRKGEPRLCEIETATEHEIDLATALAGLEKASPASGQAKNGNTAFEAFGHAQTDWAELVSGIVTGSNYHGAEVQLAAKMVAAGMADGAVVNMLRGIFESANAPRDDRWQARYDDIPRSVSTARDKAGAPQSASPGTETGRHDSAARIIKTLQEFLDGFVLPDYLLDGILQRRFVYSLTAQTGHGKTALAVLIARVVGGSDPNAALGRHGAEKGHVVYFAGENPDDLCMRCIGDEHLYNDRAARISFIPGTFSIEAMRARIEAEIKLLGGVDLVIVDTSAAYFNGKDEISNTEMGAHARLLRTLTTLPGGPCVLVLCHPVKHVTDPSQLLPRGGGAFLAEVDGNLTLWKHDGVLLDLHHTDKLRGPGFEPISLRLETVTTTRLMDKKGRLVPTVRAVWISDAETERETDDARSDEDVLLRAMLIPGQSIAQLATSCSWITSKGDPHKSKVDRTMKRLNTDKLVIKKRNTWMLTEAANAAATLQTTRDLNGRRYPT